MGAIFRTEAATKWEMEKVASVFGRKATFLGPTKVLTQVLDFLVGVTFLPLSSRT